MNKQIRMRTGRAAEARREKLPSLVSFAVALLVAGCSLVSTRESGKASKPETRDVPFQAREKADLNPRRRILVLPFIDAAAAPSEKVSTLARDGFVRSLKRTDEFVIIANTDFPKDIATYFKGGEYDLDSIAKIGSGMGLSAILEGRIVAIKAKRVGDEIGLVRQVRARIEATVQLRMISATNGRLIMNETRQASIEDTTTRYGERALTDRNLEEDPKLVENVVQEAFRTLIPRITQNVDKLTWEGRVALVKGDRIYLNAGRLSGLQLGDILKVTEEGEDVYDPDSGSLIGKVPGRLKGTVEVVSYFGKDGSVGIIHSGSGFRENDRVELY